MSVTKNYTERGEKEMAYENLQLVVAGMSGEIYLTRILKNGTMSDSRRVITEDCLRATTEWFMSNKQKGFKFESIKPGIEPHLFYTDDSDKAKRIIAILKEKTRNGLPTNYEQEKRTI